MPQNRLTVSLGWNMLRAESHKTKKAKTLKIKTQQQLQTHGWLTEIALFYF